MSIRVNARFSMRAAVIAGGSLLVLAAGACTSMQTVKQPANYIEAASPKYIKITKSSGETVTMIGAHMSGDTVMGFVERPGGAIGEFTELPITDVTQVQAQQYAHGKTLLAILGAVGAWSLITYGYVKVIESNSAK
jgi:hypothetical protein